MYLPTIHLASLAPGPGNSYAYLTELNGQGAARIRCELDGGVTYRVRVFIGRVMADVVNPR